MKQVLIRRGHVVVEDVPAPRVEPGTVLVRVAYSSISTGTERSELRVSEMPLWKRVVKRPDLIKRGLRLVASHGLPRARAFVGSRFSVGQPTGYSAAGVVLEVGPGIDHLRPGDAVACSGAQCAYHAEVIRVPRHLVVPVPDGVGLAAASTVALGAIALQGVRRAQPTLGETFVVLGLGILGQLVAQILRVNGCRVIGTDLAPARIRLARTLGMDFGFEPGQGELVEHVARLTGGIGADAAIITAATPAHSPVSTAFQVCRKKARVILVGDVGLHLRRSDLYEKELDFLISTSTGPGRYDKAYEERGVDYPIAYVRWTEHRNMTEYLRLLADGKVKVEPLIDAIHPVERAHEVYESMLEASRSPLLLLLAYAPPEEVSSVVQTVPNVATRSVGTRRIRVAVVGAGDFATTTHLPNLALLSEHFHLQAVASRTGHTAAAAARSFGAAYATTDYARVLDDPDVDAVLIATRHHLHAAMALQALQAGKHVFVEKPLALTAQELQKVQAYYAQVHMPSSRSLLMTGFNRRFSRFARRMRELLDARSNPMILAYRVNAGYLPGTHWIHGPEGGGRNLGEACHFFDLFTYLTASRVASVAVERIAPATTYYSPRDNFVVVLSFVDGSVATLVYTALGSEEYPKESLEVFVEGKVLALTDYRRLVVHGVRASGLETRVPDKGWKDELVAFARAIQQGGDWPIPLWEQVQATEIALRVEELLSKGATPASGGGRARE